MSLHLRLCRAADAGEDLSRLIEMGADAQTALECALAMDLGKAAARLLEAGAVATADMIWKACMQDKDNVLGALLNSKFGAEFQGVKGLLDIFKLGIQASAPDRQKLGANIHQNNDEPLRRAIASGHQMVAKLLLEAGADVHANNDEPIRTAVQMKRFDLIYLLLEFDADMTIENGALLVKLASSEQPLEFDALLRTWHIHVNAYGPKMIDAASSTGNSEIVSVVEELMDDEPAAPESSKP